MGHDNTNTIMMHKIILPSNVGHKKNCGNDACECCHGHMAAKWGPTKRDITVRSVSKLRA